jgi:hypothetical protein
VLVTFYSSVSMVWLADICTVVTRASDEDESTGQEGNPHYIKSKFDTCLCLTCN